VGVFSVSNKRYLKFMAEILHANTRISLLAAIHMYLNLMQ